MNENVGPLPRATGKLTFLIIAAIAIAAVAATCRDSEAAPPSDRPVVGGAAPYFTVPLISGGTFSLAKHLAADGRPIVLNFWASWCAPCREEMPAFDIISQEKPSVLVLGVAISNTPEDAAEFAEIVGVSYLLAIDNEGQVNERYPSLGLPTTWVIDENGIIRQEVIGLVGTERLREIINGEFGF
jgi:cytochrome c biogenesis protein CcmG/thiol:disulfide interchange protein DsbE